VPSTIAPAVDHVGIAVTRPGRTRHGLEHTRSPRRRPGPVGASGADSIRVGVRACASPLLHRNILVYSTGFCTPYG